MGRRAGRSMYPSMAYAPSAFTFESRAPLPWTMPVWTSGVWVQFAIGLASAAVLLASGQRGDRPAWMAAAAALLLADTLYSLPYPVSAAGLVPITIPGAAAGPSVHARQLASAVAPLRQRILAPAGTHRDAVVPAAWARLWQWRPEARAGDAWSPASVLVNDVLQRSAEIAG